MTDLKPCPFCGGKAHVVDDLITFYVQCDNCGATGSISSHRRGAVDTWDRRAALAQQDAQAASLKQALTDPENQPNQFGVEFLMHGPKFAFKVGVQQFTLDYEPEEPGEFEFMRDALIHAFSTFPPDVKAAQPADVEPVAWVVKMPGGYHDCGYDSGVLNKVPHGTMLYTHPPARVPLTDEKVREIAKQYALGLAFPYDSQTTPEMFARAIERAHGIGGGK